LPAIAGDPQACNLGYRHRQRPPKLPKAAMTQSEAAEGGAAPETKGDAVQATATASLHSSLGAAGEASPTASAERVDFKVSPSRYNVFLVVDLSRD
jgi:hypothetical protein